VSHGAAIHNLEENRFAHTQPKDFASGLMFILVGLGFSSRVAIPWDSRQDGTRLLSVPARLVLALLGALVLMGSLSSKGKKINWPAGT
jgi:hypothetical protein